jgi:hypothetical protein
MVFVKSLKSNNGLSRKNATQNNFTRGWGGLIKLEPLQMISDEAKSERGGVSSKLDNHYAGAALDDGDDLDEIIDKIVIDNF